MSGHEYYRDLAAAELEGAELRTPAIVVPSPLEQATECVADLLGVSRERAWIALKTLLEREERRST